MEVHVHIIVRGLVQGVGFRWFVQREAQPLNIRGWVRNLPNGNVEIEAEGTRPIIEEFIKHVRIGPRSAQVRDLSVDWREAHPMKFTSFEIR